MLYEYQLLSSPLADFVDFKYFERPNKNSKKYFDSTFSFSPVITWKHQSCQNCTPSLTDRAQKKRKDWHYCDDEVEGVSQPEVKFASCSWDKEHFSTESTLLA